ncbi:uncharacterized protein LOC131016627 [Salvia miltiorrhiza]|uniref:uncharacterized protein LOC131016627 n=1 Tax=Salvia miltiorrhiza TaxID=226208 RepID=UPI0025AC063F|nr:uncharacterized protein LOC131016627 [Salvia miltiorrhiza]
MLIVDWRHQLQHDPVSPPASASSSPTYRPPLCGAAPPAPPLSTLFRPLLPRARASDRARAENSSARQYRSALPSSLYPLTSALPSLVEALTTFQQLLILVLAGSNASRALLE